MHSFTIESYEPGLSYILGLDRASLLMNRRRRRKAVGLSATSTPLRDCRPPAKNGSRSPLPWLAPLRYPQSINPREVLCDCRYIRIMHRIDGGRSFIDRLLAGIRVHIK
jgi:hypothetical protein